MKSKIKMFVMYLYGRGAISGMTVIRLFKLFRLSAA
jgi:hypothetical protein